MRFCTLIRIKSYRRIQFGIFIFVFSFSCFENKKDHLWASPSQEELTLDEAEKFFSKHPDYISDGFDFPVGAPNAKGYVDKQPFGKNFHLGEDWNAVGRNDYGDPVYSVSHGVVKFAREEGPGWGNVILVTHRLPDGRWINSLYAHLSMMSVKKGDRIRKGARIGKIGDANRRYGPHLHFELRNNFFLPTGGGYGREQSGYLNPKEFIRANRRYSKAKGKASAKLNSIQSNPKIPKKSKRPRPVLIR
ncbi:M23 family metallopeptidase [Leptospira sp. 201903070]|uniref:M23 family metallopeptidase n=1 Tax=Leptospira ainlahdjerensis TaxID=2810033 RepID=A0ABS2UDR7_9LEPT|nr:M23 family metallopeptidase [Leptospira ainlahdjerensis]